MDGTYEITQGGQSVGQAAVTRQGLYYHFDCKCRLTGEIICRLVAICGEKSENLGIPVPENGKFVLKKKIPVSKLGTGALRIRVAPRHPENLEQFVPIRPEEPFSYLSRLKNAYLTRQNGEVGILLKGDY